jgi:hypothetical protein
MKNMLLVFCAMSAGAHAAGEDPWNGRGATVVTIAVDENDYEDYDAAYWCWASAIHEELYDDQQTDDCQSGSACSIQD